MPHYLVLNITRPNHYCILENVKFSYADHLQSVCDIADLTSESLRDICPLSKEQIRQIIEVCKLTLKEEYSESYITTGSAVHELSYETHTWRELDMMLEGSKPLAVFSSVPEFALTEGEKQVHANFLPYVRNGTFHYRKERIKTRQQYDQELDMYALPEQEWRLEAYILMKRTALITGWTEALYRMEGSLFGYTDEQNDEYIELEKRIRQKGVNGVRNDTPLS